MRTSELTGAALDWAVARCVGDHYVWWSAEGRPFERTRDAVDPWFEPSTNWSQAGPIIEREGLTLTHQGTRWGAQTDDDLFAYGPTPLIAAMRCFVLSRLGDEVEIPKELT